MAANIGSINQIIKRENKKIAANTNNIARVWEQMHLAYEYGVKNIWIVNVGDLKPMEFPISFFLDYAWDTKKWNEDRQMNKTGEREESKQREGGSKIEARCSNHPTLRNTFK